MSGSHCLELFGLGDPTGSNIIAGLALKITGTHKPPHHSKGEIPLGGPLIHENKFTRSCMACS